MKLLLKHLRSFIPRRLPTGMKSFNSWVDDMIAVSGLPNNETIRKAAATFLFRLPPTTGYIALRKMSNQLVKIANNQVAMEVLKGTNANEQQEFPKAKEPLV